LTRRAAADYNRFRAEGLRLFPGVLPLLDGLRGAGKRTGLITNGFAETHREKIALLRLERAFTAVVLADEVGMIKPDPRIFLHACSLLGTAPAATVMVGDRYERDMAGALDAGLATIWFNLNDTTLPAGVRRPDAIVATFDGVCEALGFTSAPAEGTRA
jgi:HAD superfamily hydrolase (TIGR01549 family)